VELHGEGGGRDDVFDGGGNAACGGGKVETDLGVGENHKGMWCNYIVSWCSGSVSESRWRCMMNMAQGGGAMRGGGVRRRGAGTWLQAAAEGSLKTSVRCIVMAKVGGVIFGAKKNISLS